MALSLSYILALAAQTFLEAAHIPFNGSVGPPSIISSTSAPTSMPASSTATATSSSAPISTFTPTGPIARNFRLQVISPRINIEWNNQPLTARNDLYFGIGGTVSQTCNATDCSKYDDSTTFTIANGYAQLYAGSGLQQTVYIDPNTGALQYAGSAGLFVPQSALRTGLVVRPQADGTYSFVYNDGQDRGWTGCSQEPGYPDYIGVDIVTECESGMSTGESIAIQAVPVDGPGAWAYGPPPRGACITPTCPPEDS